MSSVRGFEPRDLDEKDVKVAHELKNPLSAVKALVQLGLRNPAEDASHERLASIEAQVGRMQEILQRFLSSRRAMDDLAPARVHLGALVAGTLRWLSPRADAAGVRLSSRGDAIVEGDPRRLEEALVNLVANAIDATPAGGAVIVEVCPGADRIEILVRDTGRGIPPDALPSVGAPFFTMRAEGTGLGVAIARSAIALHGGSLRYESEVGKGTTVTAMLPKRARVA
jgi:two-component system sensor histidine kinase HydH